MRVTIYYNGEYEDSITFDAENISEAQSVAYEECASRGWEHEHCHSKIVE